MDAPEALAKTIAEDNHIVANADVSFDVYAGEIFVIMGLSGSGKSTIVRCLSRLVEPTAGDIVLDGENLLKKSAEELIEVRRHKMGMVFQSFGLMPHLNVIDNIAFPLKLQGIERPSATHRRNVSLNWSVCRDAKPIFPMNYRAASNSVSALPDRLPLNLKSGCWMSRSRRLIRLIRKKMQDEFLRIQSMLRKSIVFITHDFQEALRLADRMAIMRDGAIVQIGRPVDLILNPVDDYVREFTNDVPWESVLRAADVCEKAPRSIKGMGRVSADTQISSLLGYLAKHQKGGAVEAKDGSVIGVATASGVLSALANGTNTAPAEVKETT